MTKKKIYIAGPYSSGDVAKNVKKAMDVADKLIRLGHYPYCPQLTHFLHMNKPHKYEKWLEIDAEYLKVCDAVLRIPGYSNGAEKEVELAKSLNIPVFQDIKDIPN